MRSFGFRLMIAAILAALALLVFVGGPLSGGPHAWTTTFRGSPARLGATSQGVIGGAQLAVKLALGNSAAQPLYVDGIVYHAAGPWLYALDAHELFRRRGGSLEGDPEAPGPDHRPWFLGKVRVHPCDRARPHATPTYAQGAIYAAVGCDCDSCRTAGGPNVHGLHYLSALRADFYRGGGDGTLGIQALSATVVSSPLVLSGGEVVVCTREDGNVWIVRGLIAGSPRWRRQPVDPGVSAWTTSSPAPFGEHGFVVGRDAPTGLVRAFYVEHVDPSGRRREDFEPAWGFVTPAGVPASFAVHNGRLYFADKGGMFYCLGLADGKPLWQFDLRAERLFVNHSPSVADGVVYFAVRRGAGGRGEVLALDAETGSLRWRGVLPWQNPRNLFGDPPMANTGTLVTGDGHVLVGDHVGRLVLFRSGPGPAQREGSIYRLHADPGWIYTHPLFWQAMQGISTEITAAGGLLLFGHLERGSDGSPRGFLNILHPVQGYLPDIEVQRLSRVSSGAVQPGQTVEYRAELVLHGAAWPVTTAVFWRYAGDSRETWRGWQEVTFFQTDGGRFGGGREPAG